MRFRSLALFRRCRAVATRAGCAFSVAVAVVLVAMVGAARADLVEIATGHGSVDDATAERVLVATDNGGLQIEDVATAALTDVPLPNGQQPKGTGRLIEGGALFGSSPTDVTAGQLNEWHDGTLTSLGKTDSADSLAVAGDYAIWSDRSSLYRLTISSGANMLVSSTAGNTDNDVASNGDVVYWAYPGYTIHRWRNGVDSLISQASPLWATYPLTDGTTVLYRETGSSANDVAFSDGTTETVLDGSSRSMSWPDRGYDYALSTGWIAYTGAPAGVYATEVWVRSPSGTLSRVSPAGPDSCTSFRGSEDCGPMAGILGVNPTGQVLYRTLSLALGAPGNTPFPLSPAGTVRFVFWESGHWYLVMDTPGAWTLFRLDTDTAILTGPPPLTSDTKAAFTFASSAQSASYMCSLDGSAAVPCSSPLSYTGLADGTHTVSIGSTDTATGEGDPTPATATWTVDTTPPAAPRMTGTDPPSSSADLSPSIQGSAESGSTVRLYATADCSGDPVAQGSAADFASPGFTVQVSYDSTTSYRATATDGAGNTSACSTPISYTEVSPPPTAGPAVSPNPVLTGDTVTFSAGASSVLPITDYQWDLDGNGSYETDAGTAATATHSYSEPGDVTVSVRVTNSHGKSGTGEVTLSVRLTPPPGPVGVSINNGDLFTNDPDVRLDVVWPAYAKGANVSNDGGFKNAQTLPVAPEIPWKLTSAGPERLPKIVYLRFDHSTETFTDDIILDQTSPTISSATVNGRASTRRVSSLAARRIALRLRAKDGNSGVARIQVRRGRRGAPFYNKRLTRLNKPGIRRLSRRFRLPAKTGRLYVRVFDAAGNHSHWKRITRK